MFRSELTGFERIHLRTVVSIATGNFITSGNVLRLSVSWVCKVNMKRGVRASTAMTLLLGVSCSG